MSRIAKVVALIVLGCPLVGRGTPTAPPGYTLTDISAGLPRADVQYITQFAFKPGDPNHVYASRFHYSGLPSGRVTRYDYAPSGELSNPVDVATGLGAALGVAFHGNEMFVATTDLATSTGGIIRLQEQGGGLYGNPVEFVNNIPTGLHQVDQLQIQGDSLYVGVGTRTNLATDETPYNGTVSWIADLSQADYSAAGANNLALASVISSTDPGKLRVFASGFRNPFGVRVDALGQVQVTDNGADVPDRTADLLYLGLQQGDQGIFPPPGTGATVSPLTTLGFSTAATGFDRLDFGPSQGKILVNLFTDEETGTVPPLTGHEVIAVDPITGALSTFIPNFGSPLDMLHDPYGRILINDYGPTSYNLYDPDSGAVYLLAAVPEPGTLILLTVGIAVLGASVWSRHRRRLGA